MTTTDDKQQQGHSAPPPKPGELCVACRQMSDVCVCRPGFWRFMYQTGPNKMVSMVITTFVREQWVEMEQTVYAAAVVADAVRQVGPPKWDVVASVCKHCGASVPVGGSCARDSCVNMGAKP